MSMDKLAEAHELLTLKQAEEAGFTKGEFYTFVKNRDYERVAPGVYAAKDAWIDELAVLHYRYPMAVFSHEEALYFYGLTDRESLVHTLTVYSGYNTRRLKEAGCKVYTVKKELLEIGRQTGKSSQGNDIPVYDLERTICDLVRSRNSVEIQDFSTALKAYAARKDKDLNRLMQYAKLFHVEKIIRSYLELLLAS